MKNKNNFIKIAMMVFTAFTLQFCAKSTSNSEAEKIKNLAISSVNKTDAEWKKELSAEQYYVLREKGTAELQAVGAGALNQAVKAVAIARGFVAPSGIDLVCVPAFADIEIDGEERTAIKLIIESR